MNGNHHCLHSRRVHRSRLTYLFIHLGTYLNNITITSQTTFHWNYALFNSVDTSSSKYTQSWLIHSFTWKYSNRFMIYSCFLPAFCSRSPKNDHFSVRVTAFLHTYTYIFIQNSHRTYLFLSFCPSISSQPPQAGTRFLSLWFMHFHKFLFSLISVEFSYSSFFLYPPPPRRCLSRIKTIMKLVSVISREEVKSRVEFEEKKRMKKKKTGFPVDFWFDTMSVNWIYVKSELTRCWLNIENRFKTVHRYFLL